MRLTANLGWSKLIRRLVCLLSFVLFISELFVVPLNAIEGGQSALGENVITFVRLNNNATVATHNCSGNLIEPRIVVTAKHCLAKFNPNSD